MSKRTNVEINVTNVNVNVNVDPTFDPKKRRTLAVLWTLAGGLISGVGANLATPRVEKMLGLNELTPPDDSPSTSLGGPSHAALAYALFLGSDAARTQYLPPADWRAQSPDIALAKDQYTYGHEAAVLRTIAAFLKREALATWTPTTLRPRPDPYSSHVLLGSGASNRLTRKLMGAPWKPRFEVDATKLAYGITKGDGTILKRWQYGREHAPNAHAVWKRGQATALQPEARNGWQQDDYLLVTRIPGRTRGTIQTILAGLHGPGSRAAELLFTSLPTKDLENLASSVDLRPGQPTLYQAVFRTSGFKELNGSHVPTRIELITETCPPHPFAIPQRD